MIRHGRVKLLAGAAALAAASMMLTACSGASNASGPSEDGAGELAGLTGVIGSKNFAEQYILGHMTGLLLNEHGASVTVNTDVAGSNPVRSALETDEFLGYWEYTGTAWVTYHGNTEPVSGAEAQFTAVKEADAAQGIAWLEPAPLNNSYGFGMRAVDADDLGITKASEIARLNEDQQTFCLEGEFAVRDDGWPGFSETYEISVPDANVMVLNGGLAYTEVAKGDSCMFGEVFTTDGRIAALDLFVVEDDLGFFPSYQGAFTLKQATLDEFPAIAEIMGTLSPLLTDEVMRELNALASVDGEDPEVIARDFLQAQGLIQ